LDRGDDFADLDAAQQMIKQRDGNGDDRQADRETDLAPSETADDRGFGGTRFGQDVNRSPSACS
jgi:hypothetical protein